MTDPDELAEIEMLVDVVHDLQRMSWAGVPPDDPDMMAAALFLRDRLAAMVDRLAVRRLMNDPMARSSAEGLAEALLGHSLRFTIDDGFLAAIDAEMRGPEAQIWWNEMLRGPEPPESSAEPVD